MKALAVGPAVTAAAPVIVVADADVWCDSTGPAVTAVIDGAAWAVPHMLVHRLTETATADLMAGVLPAVLPTEEPPYIGLKAGGLFVTTRDTLLDVPFDPRFQGWGGEDHALGWALSTLAGRPWRGEADLWHLWHPPQDRRGRGYGTLDNDRLKRRYMNAYRKPARMRALLDEIGVR